MSNRGLGRILSLVWVCTTLIAAAGVAGANTITLGEQDFVDGQTPGQGAFDAASVGEPPPFNGTIGTDPMFALFFDESWTFNFAPSPVSSADLTLGLADHDCFAVVCSPVQSFTVDGNDFTGALNTLLRTTGTFVNAAYDVVTIDLSSVVGDFEDGILNVSLTMQAVPGQVGNSLGLDFATLTFSAVPSPGAVVLLGMGLLGLGLSRRT